MDTKPRGAAPGGVGAGESGERAVQEKAAGIKFVNVWKARRGCIRDGEAGVDEIDPG